MVKVAVLGHGTVGSGVVELFTQNAKSIASRAGQEIEVKGYWISVNFPNFLTRKNSQRTLMIF